MSEIWDDLLESVPGVNPVKDKCIVLITNNKSAQDIVVNQIKSYISKRNQNSKINSFVNNIGVTGDTMGVSKLGNSKENDENIVSSDFGFGYGLFTMETTSDDQSEDNIKLHIYTILDDSEDYEEEVRLGQFEYYKNMVELYIKADQFKFSDIVIMPVLDFIKVKDASEWPKYLRRWLIDCFSLTLNTESQKRINNDLLLECFKQKTCEYLNSSSVNIKLNTGECDCPLGFHFIIVVVNPHSSKIINDKQCDYVLQFLRMVCLKHGGSLCYLANHENNLLINSLQDSTGFGSSDLNDILKTKELRTQEPIFLNSRGLYIPLGSDNLDQIAIVDDTVMLNEDLLKSWSRFINLSSGDNTSNTDEFLLKFKKNLASRGSSLLLDTENNRTLYNIDENGNEEAGNKTEMMLNECIEKNINLNEFLHSVIENQRSNRILPDNL